MSEMTRVTACNLVAQQSNNIDCKYLKKSVCTINIAKYIKVIFGNSETTILWN